MTESTLAQLIHDRCHDDSVGLVCGDESWTWREVVTHAGRRAQWLADNVAQPAGRQRHVGLLFENTPEHVWWVLACALSGEVSIGLNTSRSAAEITSDAAAADLDIVLTEPNLLSLTSVITGVPVVNTAEATYHQQVDAATPAVIMNRVGQVTPETLSMLMFSSGSSGRPKAVMASQGRLARLVPAATARLALTTDDVSYLMMPLFHGNSIIMNLLAFVVCGGRIVLAPRFSARGFVTDLHRHNVTYVNYVGRAMSYILATNPDPRDSDSSLRLAYGTEASAHDIAQFAARFGCRVEEGYGASEGVFRINRGPNAPPNSLGTVTGDVTVVVMNPETRTECPRAQLSDGGVLADSGAVGEMVALDAADRFEGYYQNDAATAERVRGNDFWSGDLAYRDEAGFFYFAGRSSDWLRVDGENFGAAQLETVLQRSDQVDTALAYPVHDPVTGDQVMVAIKPRSGHDLNIDSLIDDMAHAADWGRKWWPQFIRVINHVPTTANNKVDKKPLRHQAWGCDDPVYVRTGDHSYSPLTSQHINNLSETFAAHDRTRFLPPQPTTMKDGG